MSAAENPNLQAVPDPNRQLPPADLFLAPKVAAAADWAGRMQGHVSEFLVRTYRSSCNGSSHFVKTVRDRTLRIKEENPTALLAGIAGTAFALGIMTRVLKSRR